MANISVKGNIGSEPELRFTPSGHAILGFSLAENHAKKNQNNEWETTGVTWWRVSAFGHLAETMAEHLTKGSTVLIEGYQTTRAYTTKQGEDRTSLEINARSIGVVPKPPQNNQHQTNTAGAADPWGTGTTTTSAWDTPTVGENPPF